MADLDQVLRAVAAGQVVRPSTGYNAPHLLVDEDVSAAVQALARHELVDRYISGPPAITPLGEQLLAEFPAGQRFRFADVPARYRQGRANPRRRQRYH
jgi:hypothetical protein